MGTPHGNTDEASQPNSAVCAQSNADSSVKLPQVEEPRRSSSGSASLRPKTLSAAEQDCGGARDELDDSSRVFERPSRRGSKALQSRSGARKGRKAGDQPD